MRVYLPATSVTLRELLDRPVLSAPRTGFAVTPGLREWYREGDEEELEYAATTDAARASLRLLEAEPRASRRRVVLAVDVASGDLQVRDDIDRAVVRVSGEVALDTVAAILIDDRDAEADVARAVGAIDAADLGDPDAEAAVDDTEGYELGWYATQELAGVLRELDEGGPATR